MALLLQPIKKTLVDRLECSYPYRADPLAASILQNSTSLAQIFVNKSRSLSNRPDICGGVHDCKRFELYSTEEGVLRMQAEMDKKMNAASQQLSQILCKNRNGVEVSTK